VDFCYGNSVIRLTQLQQTRAKKLTGTNRPFLLLSLTEDRADLGSSNLMSERRLFLSSLGRHNEP
jgi:hypothetical protein